MAYYPIFSPGVPYKYGNRNGHNTPTLTVGSNKLKYITSDGQRYPRSVLYFKCADNTEGTIHPTQKPVALLEYLIKTYTLEGETVLDNTMGSGSTIVACENTNRIGIGIEKDIHYFDVACARLAKNYVKPPTEKCNA